MLFNSVSGLCERRLILNWRVDPELVVKHLPRPFRPRLVNGKAIVGVDILKLANMRLTGLPGFTGFSTENAVDRVSVEWDEGGAVVKGLYVPYRYSPSAVNTIVSMTRLFPTVFTFANFAFSERGGIYRVTVRGEQNQFELEARQSKEFSDKSVFKSAKEASDFHRDSRISYSPSADENVLDAVYLKSLDWQAKPLEVKRISCSYVERLYPKAAFDSALIMFDTKHEWHGLGAITVQGAWAEKNPVEEKPSPKAAKAASAKTGGAKPAAKPAAMPAVKKSEPAKKIATKKPADKKAVVTKATAKKPVAKKPAAKKPAAKKDATAKKPVAKKAVPAKKTVPAKKPATKKVVQKKSAAKARSKSGSK